MLNTVLFLLLALGPALLVASTFAVLEGRFRWPSQGSRREPHSEGSTTLIPTWKLRALNRLLDGKLRRRLEGARIKLDPWGTWLFSTYLDSSPANWHESAETRKLGVPMSEANLLASPIPGSSKHILILDIDHNARWVPSSTPGKGHLYVNVDMSFLQVKAVLDAMVFAGVVHKNYASHSTDRGYSNVRPPWQKKPTNHNERFSSDFYIANNPEGEEHKPEHIHIPFMPTWSDQRKAMGL